MELSFRVITVQVYFKEVTHTTTKRIDLVDLTDQVTAFVETCDINDGICLIDSPHSTTAIVVNEHERGLMTDLLTTLQDLFPRGRGWLHDRVDDNAEAHMASMFLGHATAFPIQHGRLYRGTWQNIFLVELDGPRTRRVLIEVLGTA
jgi:secondary thiamine-phosphate synthase enzyme